MTSAMKRIINLDIKGINKLHLDKQGIYIQFDEENMLKAKAMIIGPENTPFANGVLFFEIDFPTNYPYSPPKVQYYSASRHRIHPNLYVGRSHNNFLGKVCLSILNTWAGPQWTTVMHIGSILMSIQSLLCDNPLHNEPGFENEVGIRNDTYNQIVHYDTFDNLIWKNCFQTPEKFSIFSPQINEHILNKGLTILKDCSELAAARHEKSKVSLNIYNITIIMDYKRLNKILIGLIDEKFANQ